MTKRIIHIILLLVILQGFLFTAISQNTSTQGNVILGLSVLDLPDNVKQVDCYATKNAKNFPWGMRLAQTSDVSVDEIYTPLAGDLDNDGIPEIVVTQGYWSGHSTGKIQVFEGNDLSKKSQLIDLGADVDYYCGAHVVLLRVPDKLNPMDTIGLIIVHTESGLRSYKYDGINNITLFKSNTTSVLEGTIASADFNNDGIPEVYCGNMVFDAYSLSLIGTGTSNSALSYFHWTPERVSYAADVLPNVAGTELICGSVIYTVDVANKAVNVVKTITPPAGFTSEGQTEVADFDGDGLLDVLVKQNSTTFGVYAYDPRTGKILFSKTIASGTEQNFPMIGDIDADKKPEVVLLYQNTMKAYKYDGTNLNEFWSLPIQDASGSTGMTLFDFNQDGLKEIVYRDEANLRIINGSRKSHLTGADTTVYNLSIFPVASKTIAEYPIVVDCDADGEAEILLQGRASGSTSSRLHMFKSLTAGAWAPARTVWNQYAYNVTNVNKNLTIPKTLFNNATYFSNGKQPFNNFQEQSTLINKNGNPFFKAQFDTTRIDTSITKGQSYIFGGKTYTDNATDTLRLKNSFGCDSLVCLKLSVFNYPDNVDSATCVKTPSSTIFGIQHIYKSTELLYIYALPLVGDLSGDGTPEIVSLGTYSTRIAKDIKIFDNQLNLVKTITTPYIFSYNTMPFALGKVDPTQKQSQIIIALPYTTLNAGADANVLKCYNYDGTLLWTSDPYYNQTSSDWDTYTPIIGFADFNGDGVPEVYAYNRIYNAQTGKLLAKGSDTGAMGKTTPANNNGVPAYSSHPVAADVDGDGLPELIAGNEVYKVKITNTNGLAGNSISTLSSLALSINGVGDGFTSVADLDLDGMLDVIVTRRSTDNTQNCMYAWNPRTGKLLGNPVLINPVSSISGPSQALIGDIDGDGAPEICFNTEYRLHAYKYDKATNKFNSKWDLTTSDASGATGITLFDFNQDGKMELVYRDMTQLRIIDGSGSIASDVKTIPCTSGTATEYPVVADINNDGSAEIVVSSNPNADPAQLYVYAAVSGNWAPARPVWNQYAYNVTNVNKDLTIPKTIFNNATRFPNGKYPYNNFLQQATTINQKGDPFVAVSPDTSRIDTTIMKGQSYTFGGKTYTDKAIDTLRLKNSFGCDSVVVLNLRVLALKSYNYIACPSSNVRLEIVKETGKTYAWYSAKTGGTRLGSDTMLIYTKTKASVDTVWLQIDSKPRVAVPIYLSTICASTTETACPDGTILFKEDFGGNSTSDPTVKPTGISQISYTYNPNIGDYNTWGTYLITKKVKLHPNTDIWFMPDDHTYPNDLTKGYLMQVDATAAAGQFYTYTINNLCPKSHLTFSCWMKSLLKTNHQDKANVIFELLKPNGEMIAKYYSGDVPDADDTWKQYGFDFSTPSGSDTLVLNIINNGSGSNGNDFVMDDIEIRLCVPPVTISISPKDTVCVGDSVSINAQFVNDGSFTQPLAYKWFKKVSPTDSWTELPMNTTSLPLDSVTLSDQGYYRVAVSSSGSINLKNCRAMSDSVYLKVNKCVAVTDNFCSGRTYSFNGHVLNSAGVYTDTLTSSLGADSIITLKLIENPLKKATITKNICYGTGYNFNGHLLTASGVYKDTIATTGCDSVITLILEKGKPDTTYINASINQGEIYSFAGQRLNSSGIYNYKTQTVGGCDSIIILNLSVDSSSDSSSVIPAQGFSPNGDGVNDYFQIANIEQYPKNHITIFNRWGNKVYEIKPYMNQWDGRSYFGLKVGGDLLPVGTYFYILDLGDGSKIKKGFVYLNR
jgi:gliding motility-associated-like protein